MRTLCYFNCGTILNEGKHRTKKVCQSCLQKIHAEYKKIKQETMLQQAQERIFMS